MSPADEARAAVAVCIRWGSYFAALADASRPFSPHARDENTSHIADSEMARLNIEISAAFQWWLTLKGSDDRRYTELAQRALTHLPAGQKTVTHVLEGDIPAECAASKMATAVQSAWPKEFLERDLELARDMGPHNRQHDNTLVLANGPVENVHAGRRPGHRFNEPCFTSTRKAIIAGAERASRRLERNGAHGPEGAWPPPPSKSSRSCVRLSPQGLVAYATQPGN